MTLDLFFDTTENGMGEGAVSVATKTDKIFQLLKIRPNHHSPPVCDFVWGSSGFPGNHLGDQVGGNQRRGKFRCIVDNVKQRFTLFSSEAIPLRATLNIALREFRTLEDQLPALNRNSPDRTNSHVLQRGESLSAVAGKHYLRPSRWRQIAEENGIEDPRRIAPGTVLRLPRVRTGERA
jgi:nucleoid-associated protein YgaU